MGPVSIFLTLSPPLLAPTAQEGPAGAEAAPVVARVVAENPSRQATSGLLLRGTLPLPPEYSWPEVPLALAREGRPIPTQVTVLTTYPIPDPAASPPLGRPEIVELAAKIDFKILGGTYDVVRLDAAPALERDAPRPGPALAALLGAAAPLVLRGSDLFGNEYRAEIPLAGEPLEFFRKGPLVETRIDAVTMRPVAREDPAGPPLPALWRARAYTTRADEEDFLLLDLVLHNGPIAEDVLGPFWFRELAIGVREPFGFEVWKKGFGPTGASRVEDGRTWLDLVPPLPEGKMHFVPDLAGFTVRMAVTAPEARARARRLRDHAPIFVPLAQRDLYSWSNPRTARYDANKYPLPRVPAGEEARVRERLERAFADFEEAGRRGGVGAGFHAGKLGWALPWDVSYGGATGGGGLAYVYEHETVATGHRRSMDRILLLCDRVWERTYRHLYFEDGAFFSPARHPFHMGNLLHPGGAEPLAPRAPAEDPHPARNWLYKGYLEPIPREPFLAHARAVEEGNLRPSYEPVLRGYDSYDDQHLSRAFHMLAAFYLLADPVSRDRILTTALAFAEIDRRNLPSAEAHVEAHPGKGIPAGRGDGWTHHVAGAALNLARDPEVRRQIEDVLERRWRVFARAQSPETGNFARNPAYEKIFGGEDDWDQGWESGCILADGAKCVVEAFRGGPRDEVADLVLDVMKRRARLAVGAGWNAAAKGMFRGLRIGPPGKPDEIYVPPIGEGLENYYLGTPFAWYWEITGDPVFLRRALDATGLPDPIPWDRFFREFYPHGLWTYLVYLAQTGKGFPR